MNIQTSPCDPRRITAFLARQLDNAEQAALEAHLSKCATCHAQLGDQTAELELWDKASRYLRDDQAEPDPVFAELEDAAEHNHSLAVQQVLDALGPTDDPDMLGRLGNYEVSGVIGAGGMGIVLKALDKSLDRTVAIKVMAPHLATDGGARKRFAREAKAAAAVLHPNVLAIHSVSTGEQPLPYLVMPYLRGTSLQKRLDREGPLPVSEILRIAAQTAAGLAAAHAQGLVHRDIKPANLLLEDGVERVAISDFGLARAVDDSTMTRTGVVAGTPQYMSPEQARGEAVDQRSDLFSLGSVLYAMCAGRPPFRAESSYGVLRRIIDDEPTSIRELNPDIPDWLCRVVQQLMAKRPEARFESAQQVAKLLEECLAHVQQPVVSPLPAQLALPSSSRRVIPSPRRTQGVFAMLAGLGLCLLGMVLWQSSAPSDISGRWSGDGWGEVVLAPTQTGEYQGTFTGAGAGQPGTLELKWSRLERRYNGSWQRGEAGEGKISLRFSEDAIRGAWTTGKNFPSSAESPRLAELHWTRPNAARATGPELPASTIGTTGPAIPDSPLMDPDTATAIPQLAAYRFPSGLEGRWRIVEAVTGDKSLASYVGQTAEIQGNALWLRSSQAANKYVLTFVEPQGAHLAVDLTAEPPELAANRAMTFRCILQISEHQLRLCRPQNASRPRPRDLNAPDRSETVFTFERDGSYSQLPATADWLQLDLWKGQSSAPAQVWEFAPPDLWTPVAFRRLEICEAREVTPEEATALGQTGASRELLYLPSDDGQRIMILRRRPTALLTEADVVSAIVQPSADREGEPEFSINLELTAAAAERFAVETQRLANQDPPVRLAILVPGRILTAPLLRSPITGGKVVITGNFSRQEAELLATELRGTPLLDPTAPSVAPPVEPSVPTLGPEGPGLRVKLRLKAEDYPREILLRNMGLDGLSIFASGVSGTVDGQPQDNLVAVLAHQCRLEALEEINEGEAKYWKVTIFVPQGPSSDGSNRTLTQGQLDSLQEHGAEFKISPLSHLPGPATVEPAWGEPVRGIQVGLGGIRNDEHFVRGATVRLQLFVRNTGSETVRIRYVVSAHADWIAPRIATKDGAPVRLNAMAFRGGHVTYDETLAPGMVAPIRVAGIVVLGESETAHRFWPRMLSPAPGEYVIDSMLPLTLFGANNVGEAIQVTTGSVRLHLDEGPAASVERPPSP